MQRIEVIFIGESEDVVAIELVADGIVRGVGIASEFVPEGKVGRTIGKDVLRQGDIGASASRQRTLPMQGVHHGLACCGIGVGVEEEGAIDRALATVGHTETNREGVAVGHFVVFGRGDSVDGEVNLRHIFIHEEHKVEKMAFGGSRRIARHCYSHTHISQRGAIGDSDAGRIERIAIEGIVNDDLLIASGGGAVIEKSIAVEVNTDISATTEALLVGIGGGDAEEEGIRHTAAHMEGGILKVIIICHVGEIAVLNRNIHLDAIKGEGGNVETSIFFRGIEGEVAVSFLRKGGEGVFVA